MNLVIPKIRDFDDPNYDPAFSDEAAFGDALDPYPLLQEIAARGSVQEEDFRALQGIAPDSTLSHQRIFIVFGYDEIREVFSNTDNFCMAHFQSGLAQTFGSHSLTVLDPPDHSRYRRIFQKAFLPHIVGTWSVEYIEPVINELMDRFIKNGHCDLMKEFVFPYPFEIIYRQLKLPPDDARIFQRLSVALTLYTVDLDHAREAHDKLGTYFKAVIDERRRNPGTDLISVLATVELDGEYLPDEALLSFLRQLMNAAGDTTFRSTGNMLVGLLAKRPDQFELLKADRSLVARAIEETLRWEAPTLFGVRTVKRDTELGGKKMPAGSIVQVIQGIANRDGDIYPDPDTFDITRAGCRTHVAFGAGPHVCLGQHLARLEMTRAMNILLDRLPRLRLDPDYPKPEIRGNTMRRPKHLYVRFD
jgi:cytochrome P450